jgi:4-aminobutyrate aminotransferase-like enzyme
MPDLGQFPPQMTDAFLPGPFSTALIDRLAATEVPTMTGRRARGAESSGAPTDPIVWAEAKGANVVDADGNRFVDLTAGFGAAAIGHRHPRLVAAIKAQSDRLLHALGDLHPSDVKIKLLERLSALAPFANAKVVLGIHGADAVEVALKTAVLAHGKPGILAFTGGYHGLSYGPLAACGYSEQFRLPFAAQLNPRVWFAPFPSESEEAAAGARSLDAVQACFRAAGGQIGAVLVEPAQGRGGVIFPPVGFLAELQNVCHQHGALLIADEIYTGLGRCGAILRSQVDRFQPDMLCIGKALGGGMPISACLGKPEVMDVWGDPRPEALHTATFFGHPLACAAALASLEIIESEDLVQHSRVKGQTALAALQNELGHRKGVREIRGQGLMIGIELDSAERTSALVHDLLTRGYITVPAGVGGNVLSLTPPFTISSELLSGFVSALAGCMRDLS